METWHSFIKENPSKMKGSVKLVLRREKKNTVINLYSAW